jgi:lipid A ethanolaminephosphotransferase
MLQIGAAPTESLGSARRLVLAILGVALYIALIDNVALFTLVLERTAGDEHRIAIFWSLFVLLSSMLLLVLSVAAATRTFKLVASVLLVVAAAFAYFMHNYGILIDISMIRNVAETDVREASPLLTQSLLAHVTVYGGLPALLLWIALPGRVAWRRCLATSGSVLVATALVLVSTLYVNYGPVSYFMHQNHTLRMQMNPTYAMYALVQYLTRDDDGPRPNRQMLEVVSMPKTSTDSAGDAKPVLFVFVMGETARADRFSWNGYPRETNPYTRERDVVNFGHVTACGTSTADSVPCIFSRFDRSGFSHARFAANETLFGTLERMGVDVWWRDNSTGCKDVCTPSNFEELAGEDDIELCRENVCLDEILLKHIERLFVDDERDHFLVLHQRGSHGPAYFLDTPDRAKVFMPECHEASLQSCDLSSINNAYDNTIVYTDYFLSRVVDLLAEQSDRYRTAMLYVSDHGESLGEKGLYLHGLPFAIAPDEQTRVPMMLWASSDFETSKNVDPACLRKRADRPLSHAAIFHTVLSVFDLYSPVYDESLDLFAPCQIGHKRS